MLRFEEVPAKKVYVDTYEKVEAAIHEMDKADVIAVDVETLGKRKNVTGEKGWFHYLEDQVLYMGICYSEEKRLFIPRKYLRYFKDVLQGPSVKVIHNAKFDLHRLENAGIRLGGRIADTMVMDWLLDEDTREGRHRLEHCSPDYLGIPMGSYKDIVQDEDPRTVKPGHPRWEQFLDYGTLDAYVTFLLYEYMTKKLSEIDLWGDNKTSLLDYYWLYEESQIKAMYNMERRGINIDKIALKDIDTKVGERVIELSMEFTQKAAEELFRRKSEISFSEHKMNMQELNINSNKQLCELFFKVLGWRIVKRTPGGSPQIDASALKILGRDHELAKILSMYRKEVKLKTGFTEAIAKHIWKDGKIHYMFTTPKVTGRAGTKEPNVQQIPARDSYGIRRIFVPDPGCVFIGADYAQLEWRVMAHFCRDPALLKCFHEGYDMHCYVGSLMIGMDYDVFYKMYKDGDPAVKETRSAAKVVGFGLLYGATGSAVARNLSDSRGTPVSPAEGQQYIDQFLKAFPGVKAQMNSFIKEAKEVGQLQTLTGRFRRLSKIRSRNFKERGHAENQALNSPIQGSAADIVKKAMIRCESNESLQRLGCTLRIQVHDELIFNAPEKNAKEAAEIIQGIMENPFGEPLIVPLPAIPDIGYSWQEVK